MSGGVGAQVVSAVGAQVFSALVFPVFAQSINGGRIFFQHWSTPLRRHRRGTPIWFSIFLDRESKTLDRCACKYHASPHTKQREHNTKTKYFYASTMPHTHAPSMQVACHVWACVCGTWALSAGVCVWRVCVSCAPRVWHTLTRYTRIHVPRVRPRVACVGASCACAWAPRVGARV